MIAFHSPTAPSLAKPHPAVKQALGAILDSGEAKINGYPHSAGLVEARETIAQMSSSDNCKLTHEVVPKLSREFPLNSLKLIFITEEAMCHVVVWPASSIQSQSHNIRICFIARGDNCIFVCTLNFYMITGCTLSIP